MAERWYFHREGRTVVLRARMEGDDGTIGDARDEVRPGMEWFGLTYRALFDAEGGEIVVEDEKARIVA